MKKLPLLKGLEDAGALWRTGGAVLDRVGGAARAWACGGMAEGPILAALPDATQAERFVSDHQALFPERSAFLLRELPLTSIASRPLRMERGETLRRWGAEGGVLAASPGALMAPCLLGEGELTLRREEPCPRDSLVAWLERNGYQRADLVWSPGQYVLRGFVLDVFDPAFALPFRLEFVDERLERAGLFQPATQRTTPHALFDSVSLHGLADASGAFPADLLPPGVRVLLCDPQKLESQAFSFRWLWNGLVEVGQAPDPIPAWDELLRALALFPHIRLTQDPEAADAELPLDPLPPFKGSFSAALGQCRGCAITVRTVNPRFLDTQKGPLAGVGGLTLERGGLSSGFIDRAAGRAFLSDRELSGITAATAPRAPLEWRDQFSAGQLVVHEEYGVGVFRGVEEVTVKGVTMDTLVLEFADHQRLLVPVLQSQCLTPLAEHENEEVPLDSLRGSRWRKAVERNRERARQEAHSLIEIFARREMERREPLAEPDDLYHDFVASFPYVETSDQLRAVAEIMRDLSGPFPMDRLLVGDVGFGKTEVALRAAFRAVGAGYQVCVLVPTTILAQQHYTTFLSRLAGFPVTVGLLSRFVPRKEAVRTLQRAQEGQVDILIGTHRLLQKGVAFKKLGLLIIDEEHRFGVMHKEELKRTYGSVDTLSLSATPIPRTLAMALRGLRGISILSTPPENRLPVATFAGPWQPALIQKAVAYELTRGGQVYFLCSRIAQMEAQRQLLERLFPQARIRIAHGQMPERDLEAVMMDFYAGTVDILVATTIIESGLDVGRANTIIITDSQELGLAQMYQLRGRVGRRGEQGFAYFFYPLGALKQETADRLEAISTLTELGSGYAIARRDLDIRGGGEIGGTKQHGSGGGFPLFYRMLEEELARLRGAETRLTELVYDQSGSIPIYYIPQEGVRVVLYRRLLQAVGLDELTALLAEVQDRFGPPPKEVRLLAALTAIRAFGRPLGLDRVSVERARTTVKGTLKALAPSLRRAEGWVVMNAYAEGPGGLAGAEALFTALREAPVEG